MSSLLQRPWDPRAQLMHQARECWRQFQWRELERARPQHYRGIAGGINRELTTSLLTKWSSLAAALPTGVLHLDPLADPRPRLKVLRLLLSGGLMHPDRNGRHRREFSVLQCACGKPTNLYHISWECTFYADHRQPALDQLPCDLTQLPTAFVMTTTVPTGMSMTRADIEIIQSSLVTVWQHQIQDWHHGTGPYRTQSTTPVKPPDDTTPNQAVPEEVQTTDDLALNGHVLKTTDSGGIFCQKCGKSTYNPSHQRLKILRFPCRMAALPKTEWLASPGAFRNEPRLNEQERLMNEKYNRGGHTLIWNRLLGKDPQNPSDYGMLYCTRCCREWAWRFRTANLPRSRCVLPRQALPLPDWVRPHLSRYTSQSSENFEQTPSQPKRRRLRSKQPDPGRTTEPVPTQPTTRTTSALSTPVEMEQHGFPRQGIG